MNVQDECIKIHSKFGMSEMANYKIQLLFDSEIEKVKKEYEEKFIQFSKDAIAENEYKSIKELIEEKDPFISSIPNNLGINLCAVQGIEYVKTKNDQLKALTILFIPE